MASRLVLLVPCVLAAAAAATEPPRPARADGKLVVVVLDFQANAGGQHAASGVTSWVASRVAESPDVRLMTQSDVATALTIQQQKERLGQCAEQGCAAELSDVLGARYVITGRVDRIGGSYAVVATLFDSEKGAAAAKPRADAPDADGLLGASQQIADEMLRALGVAWPGKKESRPGAFSLSLKFGNQFLSGLTALSPSGKLELGWGFDPEWAAFLQVGFSVVRSHAEQLSLTVVPSVLGVRKLYRLEEKFQPYWGVGLGLQLTIGDFGFVSQTQSFPTVVGLFGFQYMLTRRLGALLEASTNFSQAVLGLRSEGKVGDGLNFDLVFGIHYRF